MKAKVFVFFLSFFLCHSYTASAQSNSSTTSKSASLVEGMFSFSSRGEGSNTSPFTSLSGRGGYHYFLIDKFALGMNLAYGRVFIKNEDDFRTWSVGPSLRYFFDKGNKFVPYLGAGVNHVISKSDGLKARIFRTNLSGGLAVFKKDFALLYEMGIDFDRFKADDGGIIKGYTFYISFGAAISLFSNEGEEG